MPLVQVTAPAEEPLNATEVKSRLSIGSEVSDDVIEAFITAARQTLDGRDGRLQRCLMQQSWKLTIDSRFPCEPIKIPLPPLISIDSVRYVDPNGAWQTVAEENYRTVEGYRAEVVPVHGVSWPSTRCQLGAVEIEFTAGYGTDPADVPEPIRQAITLMVSNLRSLSARNLFLSQDTVDGVGSKYYVVGGNAAAAIDATVDALLGPYRVYA
jgi:uncharacterized phiE125 gp8 family phage protein